MEQTLLTPQQGEYHAHTILFNGHVIEVGHGASSDQRLSPALTKETWRGQLQEKEGSIRSHYRFDALEYISSQDSSYLKSYASEQNERIDKRRESQVTVWSGWLSKRCRSSLGSALMRLWRKRWFVLTLSQGRFFLSYYIEENKQTCAMALRRTFVVGYDEPARLEHSPWGSKEACFSVPIEWSNRRLVLASSSAGEADFLVESLNSLKAVVASA